MFDAARMSIAASRMLEDGVDPAIPPDRRGRSASRIDWRTAFYLATAGGGDVLDLPVGRFVAGHAFDAIIVDTQADGSNIRIFDDIDTPEDVLAKILYSAAPRNITSVFVAGRSIKS
jgi:guanine deaminase